MPSERGLGAVSLDFKGYRRKPVHPYPATMPYRLAATLVERYSLDGDMVFDPFLGSGTTLLAATALGRRAVGCDINPLACLIARVALQSRSQGLDFAGYHRAVQAVGDRITTRTRPLLPPEKYRPSISRWFAPDAIKGLGAIARAIKNSRLSTDEMDFLYIAFSRTVRACSRARSGELKLWRRPGEYKVEDPREVFSVEARRLANILLSYASDGGSPPMGEAKVVHGDAGEVCDQIKPVDLVVTSPPYGDSWTTVAYGNYSSLSLFWLGAIDRSYLLEDPTKADDHSPGGPRSNRMIGDWDPIFQVSRHLEECASAVRGRSETRSLDVLRFFGDMYWIMLGLRKAVRVGGRVVIVTGTRRVTDIPIDTGRILGDFMTSFGFEMEDHATRTVTGKRLPSRTRQGNGVVATTINIESINVFRSTLATAFGQNTARKATREIPLPLDSAISPAALLQEVR